MKPMNKKLGILLISVILLFGTVVSASTMTFYTTNITDGTPARNAAGENFTTIWGGAGTTTTNTASFTTAGMIAHSTSGNYSWLYRSEMNFDTSALPDSCTITSARFIANPISKANGLGSWSYALSSDFIPINANSTPHISDYQNISNINVTLYKTYEEITTSAWNTWTFSRTNYISKTGITPLMFRSMADIQGNVMCVTWSSSASSSVSLYSADSVLYPPRLEVDYTAAPTSSFTPSVVTGMELLTVTFTDTSAHTPTNWDWYWSADEVKDSDLQSPSASFTAGTYSVRLYTSNAYGGNWSNSTNLITATGFVPSVTALPQTTYQSRYLDPFMAEEWNFSALAPIMVSVYGDPFGNVAGTYAGNGNTIVIGAWMMTLLAMYWLRSESALVPMFLLVIMGTLFLFIPGMAPPEWIPWIVLLIVVLPIAGIIYSVFKRN